MIFQKEDYKSYLEKIKDIYREMDKAYEKIAGEYGFKCTGCDDNCCLTRFYHHTWIEYFYIKDGYLGLDDNARMDVRKKACRVIAKTKKPEQNGSPIRIMCPLNEAGKCILYEYRPMICRLHGIAHEFSPPGGKTVLGRGCHEFEKQTRGKNYIKFDRTPFYMNMARLEGELRKNFGISGRIKLTIAEIIESFYEKDKVE